MGRWVPYQDSATLRKADTAVGSVLGRNKGTKVRIFRPYTKTENPGLFAAENISASNIQLYTTDAANGAGVRSATFDEVEAAEVSIDLPKYPGMPSSMTLLVKTFDFGELSAGEYWLGTTGFSYPQGLDWGYPIAFFFPTPTLLMPITVVDVDDNATDFTGRCGVW